MKTLIIVAHPDDEVLGCGGTAAKSALNSDIYTLIMGEGVTSRDLSEMAKKEEVKQLRKNAESASEILGVRNVFFEGFPDNKFDAVALLDIIKIIDRYIQRIKPDVVYTHHQGDLNIDHQILHKAVLTATRPIENCSVKKIYTFEVLSSTEWNTQSRGDVFIPNIYVDISNTIDKKLGAMGCYESEIRHYPHPRSLEGIKILAQKRGLEVGLKFAEAFCLIRGIE